MDTLFPAKQTTLQYITFVKGSGCIFYHVPISQASVCVCICNTCQRKCAAYYLVYLDIWLLLFRTVPTQILLITLTNSASPLWHKSKQDTVVAPSQGPNLNVSAGVSSGTENPYAFCVQSLLYCTLADIVWSCTWQGSVNQSAKDSWWEVRPKCVSSKADQMCTIV